METLPVQPLNHNVYIQEEIGQDSKSKAGFRLYSKENKPISGLGTIVAISQATIDRIKEDQGIELKVGQKVYFSRFSAEEVLHFVDGVQMKGLQKLHISSLSGVYDG